MTLADRIRPKIKAARKRGASWVAIIDWARSVARAEGRARLWTKFRYAGEVHQTTPFTCADRYPELFDAVAGLVPRAKRILSFGCSTGEELLAIRRRFPQAEIVGAEINARSRRLARKLTASDPRISVIAPNELRGRFDAIFALAVFQREPHKVEELEIDNLSPLYPFERFNAGVMALVERLKAGGFLCVTNSHYRVEDSSAAAMLKPVSSSPPSAGVSFGHDGRRTPARAARTIFRKVGDARDDAASRARDTRAAG
jgi:hypothetical protein